MRTDPWVTACGALTSGPSGGLGLRSRFTLSFFSTLCSLFAEKEMSGLLFWMLNVELARGAKCELDEELVWDPVRSPKVILRFFNGGVEAWLSAPALLIALTILSAPLKEAVGSFGWRGDGWVWWWCSVEGVEVRSGCCEADDPEMGVWFGVTRIGMVGGYCGNEWYWYCDGGLY